VPITPISVPGLLDVYDDLVGASEDLVGAASKIAPAAVRQVLCSAGGLASLLGGPLGRLQAPGTGNRMLSDMGGILEAACPVPPPLPEPPQPLPGQCPVPYLVSYTLKRRNRLNCADATDVTNTRVVEGPINNFQLTTPDTATCDFGGTPWIRFEVLAGPSQTLTLLESSGGNLRWVSFQIDSIERVDGLPDDCGEIPPSPPRQPIDQPPDSPPIPRIDPDGNPLPPIIFQPRVGPIYIGPRGDLNIPVTVNVGGPSFNVPISIPVNVNLPDFSPTISFGGNGGGAGPGQPPEPGPPQGICCEPPPPFTEPGEEEDPEEPPEKQPEDGRIIGLNIVTSAESAAASATVIGTANPPLRVPRIGTVQFGTGSEESEFIGPDIQIKQLRQYVAAPTGVPVTRAFVRWEPGWGGAFEYVYAPKNPRPEEEEE